MLKHFIVQGWSSIFPTFAAVDFVSYYIEIPIMVVMYIAWALVARAKRAKPQETEGEGGNSKQNARYLLDVVDSGTVDLRADEFDEPPEDVNEAAARETQKGARGWAHRVYNAIV